MTSTTAPTDAAAPRLERARDGRMIAGVASGIARHLNIDATLVRLGFVVAVVAGGFGILAYVAGLLLIPEEGEDKAIINAPSSRSASTIAGIVLLVIGALTALDGIFDDHFFGRFFWTVAFLGAGAWLLLRTPGEENATPVSTPPPTAETRVMPPAPPPPKRGRSGTRLVAGVMLLVAGGLSAIFAVTGADLDWQAVAGIAVIAAGATLAAGAFVGASPWLALPPLALGAAVASLAAAGVELDGPIGERHWAPATKADLPAEYQMAMGELDLDLRGLDLPPGTTTVRAQLGMGELHVQVPAGVEVRIDGHAGAGEVDLPGGSSDGTDVDREELIPARESNAPVLVLDAEVGFGEVRVER